MRQPALVQELDRVAGLVDDVPDLVQRVRVVVVVFLKSVKKVLMLKHIGTYAIV